MSRWLRVSPVLVVVPALIAAGCGSSSKSSTKPNTVANKPAATTPPTPQTPATGTTNGANMPVAMNGPNGVPLNSPALKTALTAQFAKDSRIPAKFDAPLADCLLKKLEASGYKTVGDAKAHPSVIRADALACAKQLTGQ